MERPLAESALVQAVSVVARGGDLDGKLDALVEHARAQAGAAVGVLYVEDPLASSIVPAAAAGIDLATLEGSGTVALDDTVAAVARAVRERRSIVAGAEAAHGLQQAAIVALPLVYTDDAGTEHAEGALALAHASADDARPPDPATQALADLCAVAIRQARLERTLLERAEWISRVASTDALTGLPNRTTFEQMLEMEMVRSSRQKAELSLVLFDVDGLAAINEQHGAHVGDDVLRATAALLAEQVRIVDGVARVGPDEFGLVAPTGGGAVVARRIRDASDRLGRTDAGPVTLASAVVVYPHDGATASELMDRAGQLLADARRQGRGTVLATRELGS